MSPAIWLTLVACLTAAYCDVRSRRIPNWLTGATALAAIALHAVEGWRPLAIALAVIAVMTLAGTVLYARGGIGGGDIKLAIAGSGLLSYPLCVPFLLYTAIGGGVLAVLYIIFRPHARPMLSRAILMTSGSVDAAAVRRESLPYAVAFAFGAVLVALSESVTPFLRIHLS